MRCGRAAASSFCNAEACKCSAYPQRRHRQSVGIGLYSSEGVGACLGVCMLKRLQLERKVGRARHWLTAEVAQPSPSWPSSSSTLTHDITPTIRPPYSLSAYRSIAIAFASRPLGFEGVCRIGAGRSSRPPRPQGASGTVRRDGTTQQPRRGALAAAQQSRHF